MGIRVYLIKFTDGTSREEFGASEKAVLAYVALVLPNKTVLSIEEI